MVNNLKDDCTGIPEHEFNPKFNKRLVDRAYVPHIGEGKAKNCAAQLEVKRYLHFVRTQSVHHDKKGQNRRYSLVHGIAANSEHYKMMSDLDVTLVWSPRSNLALYDETIDIERALANEANKVRIALATDWSPTGSFSMKEAFKCAKEFVEGLTPELSNEQLWQWATSNAAYALGLEDRLGAIKKGYGADLVLVKTTESSDPYQDVLTASDKNILATWVNGKAVLLSDFLAEKLGKECVDVESVAPKICGVFKNFDLEPEEFIKHLNNKKYPNVPLIGGEDKQALTSCQNDRDWEGL